MPKARNRTSHWFLLKRIGRDIDGDASIQLTDEEAAQLAGHPLLEITPDPVKATSKKEGDEQ